MHTTDHITVLLRYKWGTYYSLTSNGTVKLYFYDIIIGQNTMGMIQY